nr:MAG TPA: hypothetical protein [Caudoviricetes sp.]
MSIIFFSFKHLIAIFYNVIQKGHPILSGAFQVLYTEGRAAGIQPLAQVLLYM